MRKTVILLMLALLVSTAAFAQSLTLFNATDESSPTRLSMSLQRLYAYYSLNTNTGILPVQPMSDPYYNSTTYIPDGDMWGFKRIDAAYAWAISKGAGVTVAVLDSGLDFLAGYNIEIGNNAWINPNSNEEFSGHKATYGVDYCDPAHPGLPVGIDSITNYDTQYSDGGYMYNGGHGTLVSGIIAAAENANGMNGMAPQSKIMTLKVIGRDGDTTDIANAIRYAADHGIRIINMSLGVEPYYNAQHEPTSNFMPDDLRRAIDYAYSKNCILIAAAGNGNPWTGFGEDIKYWIPGRDMKVLSVAATLPPADDDSTTDFTNFGSEIDVAAPGEMIISLRSGGTDLYEGSPGYVPESAFAGLSDEYYIASGTSMAAPFVSGIAALLLAKDPTLTNDQVMNLIRFSAEDLGAPGIDLDYGYGLVNAYDAMMYRFDDSFDLLDYMSAATGDTSTIYNRYEASTSTALSQVTGPWTINEAVKVAYYHEDAPGSDEDYTESDYITIGADGYKIYGMDIDFEGDGIIDFGIGNTGQIVGFTDPHPDNSKITVTALNHGLLNSDSVTIRNTANYNGNYTVTNVTPNSFEITAVWHGDDVAGEWAYYNIADSMGDISKFEDLVPADGKLTVTAPGHGLANGSVIRIGNGLTGMGSISNFTDAGSGQVTITDVAHGLQNGDYVSIRGTKDYDGDYLITGKTNDTFNITHSYFALSPNNLNGYWLWYYPDPYNGQYTISGVTTDTFQIEAAWLSVTVPATWTRYATSALLCPGTLEEGRTYYAEMPFVNYGVKYSFSSSVTVNGTEDITLDSGVIMKDALKLTWEMAFEDLEEFGFYSSGTRISWYKEGIGEVKSVLVDDADKVELCDLRTATTYYTPDRKRAEFLDYTTNPVFIYKGYNDNALNTLYKAQRSDGSYDIYVEYHPGTSQVKYKDSYDANGNLLMRYEYTASGALKYSYHGEAASLSSAERASLYSAAYPYIKYYIDNDHDLADQFAGMARSFWLPGTMSASDQNIVDHGASSYDQTVLGTLELYNGDHAILDTFVDFYKLGNDIYEGNPGNNPVFNENGNYKDLAQNAVTDGPYCIMRIDGRDTGTHPAWWNLWDWRVDVGAAACIIQYAAEGYDIYNNADYKALAVSLGDYILKLQDVDGGIRHGPKDEAYSTDYKTGTISTTSGESAITGIGTAWNSGMNGKTIQIKYSTTDIKDYIFTYVDPTHGTLNMAASSTVSGKSYTVFSDYFWNLKSTETNERCLLALEALYDITRNDDYHRAADMIKVWLKTMYVDGETFSGSSSVVSGSWVAADLSYMPTDVTAFADLDMMFTDTDFGDTQLKRNQAVEDMFEAVEHYNGFLTNDNATFFKFTGSQASTTGGSVEWSSQMACAYLEAAYSFLKYGDNARKDEYLIKYNTLMASLDDYFSNPIGDSISLIAPYASYTTTNHGIAVIDTGTGYTTLNCQAALASAYYAIALIEGLKPWKYEYEDGEIVKVTLNNRTEKFFDIGITSPSVTDLDGDGAKDLVFDYGAGIGIYAYDFTNTTMPFTQITSITPTLLAATDLDGDGAKDLVFDYGAGIGIYAYDFTNTTTPFTQITSVTPTLLAATDLDGDGAKDLVFDYGAGIGIYAYDFTNTTTPFTQITSITPTLLAATDLDGDGAKDLVFDYGAGIGIYAYDFTNTTTPFTQITSVTPTLLAATDLDGDGAKDLVFDYGAGIGIYAYDFTNTTTPFTQITSITPTLLAATDLDGDGAKDLVFDYGAGIGIYAYDFTNTTTPFTQITSVTPTLLAATDLDGDGAKDLVFDYGAGIGIYAYDFTNTTTPFTQITSVTPTLLAATDLDGDGAKDLVFDYGAGIGIYAYDFTNTTTPFTQITSITPTLLAATDLDGDGAKDLVFDYGAGIGIYAYDFTNTTTPFTQITSVEPTMPKGDEEMIARMSLESSLNPQSDDAGYTMVGEMVHPPKNPVK